MRQRIRTFEALIRVPFWNIRERLFALVEIKSYIAYLTFVLEFAYLFSALTKLCFSLFAFLSCGVNTSEVAVNNLPPRPSHVTIFLVVYFGLAVAVLFCGIACETLRTVTHRYKRKGD